MAHELEVEYSHPYRVSRLMASAYWVPEVVPATVKDTGEVCFDDTDAYKSMLDVMRGPPPEGPVTDLLEALKVRDSGKAASVCVEIRHSPEHHGDVDAWVPMSNNGFLDVLHVRATDPAVEFKTGDGRRFTLGGPDAKPNEWYPMIATVWLYLHVRVPVGGSVKVCATMLPDRLRFGMNMGLYHFRTRGKQWTTRGSSIFPSQYI
jgi:hypothetical protein